MKQLSVIFILAGTVLLSGCGDASAPQSTNSAQSAIQDAAEPAVDEGKTVYTNYCASCHTPGLSGAPKLGDLDAWAPRIAKGADLLLQATIEGVPPAMPPRGMCFDCTDAQLAIAIDYMVKASQ